MTPSNMLQSPPFPPSHVLKKNRLSLAIPPQSHTLAFSPSPFPPNPSPHPPCQLSTMSRTGPLFQFILITSSPGHIQRSSCSVSIFLRSVNPIDPSLLILFFSSSFNYSHFRHYYYSHFHHFQHFLLENSLNNTPMKKKH